MTAEAIDHRFGILVGGGPAPGINGVIYAATMEAFRNHREIVGIYDGFKHLMKGEVVGIPLLPDTVAYIHQEGGSILRTARANPEGEPIEAAAALTVGHPQVLAVGINCTPPQFIEPLLQRLRRVTDKPLVAYPNSGEAWDATRRCWLGTGGFVPSVEGPRWYRAGARLIGGCCRTGPDTIRALRSALIPLAGERHQ